MKLSTFLPLPLLLAAFATGCLADDESIGDELSSTTQALTHGFQTASYGVKCTLPHSVSAAPGEEGQWAAVRVGHTNLAFRPTSVSFYLRGSSAANGTWCAGNAGPYKIRVFYGGSSTGPLQTPIVVATQTVAAANVPATSGAPVTIPIRSTVIPEDSYIYVAVEMVGDPATDSGYDCLAGCGPRTAYTNWWSLQTGAPYGWVELFTLGGFEMDIGMKVDGDYL